MNKKELIIFDLDDTLVDTSEIYYKARESFLIILTQLGINKDESRRIFEEIDTKNMISYGYNPERYGKSMLDAYYYCLKKFNIPKSTNTVKQIKLCGEIVLLEFPELIEGATTLLKWCFKHYKMILYTRGIYDLQMKKINHVNIKRYFTQIIISDEKNSTELKKIISSTNIKPGKSWVVGDSIQSDINPGVELGAKCILYLYKHDSYYWEQEYGSSAIGEFYLAKNLPDIKDILETPHTFKTCTTIE